MTWHNINRNTRNHYDKSDLHKLLETFYRNYEKHLDWFIHHRDTAFKQLFIIISIELLIIRFWHDPLTNNYPKMIIVVFLFLSVLSIIFSYIGYKNCGRSFEASLVAIALVNKIIWSLNPTGKVEVGSAGVSNISNPPFDADNTLCVRNFISDAKASKTTDQYVSDHLNFEDKIHDNTYHLVTISLFIIGLMGFLVGILCVIEVFSNTPNIISIKTPSFLNSAGLLFDITGVLILFFYGTPMLNITKEGLQIMPFDSNDNEKINKNKKKYKTHNFFSKLGLFIITIGFTLQLIGNNI